jgi:hypothetical protein
VDAIPKRPEGFRVVRVHGRGRDGDVWIDGHVPVRVNVAKADFTARKTWLSHGAPGGPHLQHRDDTRAQIPENACCDDVGYASNDDVRCPGCVCRVDAAEDGAGGEGGRGRRLRDLRRVGRRWGHPVARDKGRTRSVEVIEREHGLIGEYGATDSDRIRCRQHPSGVRVHGPF